MYQMTFINRQNAANCLTVMADTAEQAKSYLKMMADKYYVVTRKNGRVLKTYSIK